MLFFAKNHFPTQNLLSDAEVVEDVVEGFLWGNLAAGDFGEDVEDLAEVFAEKVTAEGFIDHYCVPLVASGGNLC